tara:strand:+ start:2294 stop:3478 length:1185 start_codon:yes stop_codon:yes gene_type:complete
MSTNKNEHVAFFTLLVLALIPSVIEIDILAPSLPSIGQYFNVSISSTQSIITLNFLGCILGALFYGPLSEKLSIRNLLLFGLLGIILSSIGCYFAPSIEFLLCFRIIQGLSSCAVLIMVIASFPYLFKGRRLLSFFGYLNSVTALSIAIAPIIGNYINLKFSWREIFILIGGLACMSLLLNFYFLRPSHLIQKKNKVLSLSAYKEFKHKKFILPTLIISFMGASDLIFVSSSSFIYEKFFGFSNYDYIIHYTCIILSFVMPSFLFHPISKLLKGTERTEKYGLFCCMTSAICFILNAAHPFIVTISLCLYSFGFAISSPIIFTRIMSVFPSQTCTSSSMNVFIRNLICMGCMGICSMFFQGNPFHIALEIVILNVVILLIWLCEKHQLGSSLND